MNLKRVTHQNSWKVYLLTISNQFVNKYSFYIDTKTHDLFRSFFNNNKKYQQKLGSSLSYSKQELPYSTLFSHNSTFDHGIVFYSINDFIFTIPLHFVIMVLNKLDLNVCLPCIVSGIHQNWLHYWNWKIGFSNKY